MSLEIKKKNTSEIQNPSEGNVTVYMNESNQIMVREHDGTEWVYNPSGMGGDVRLFLDGNFVKLQISVLGTWTDTGTDWQVISDDPTPS